MSNLNLFFDTETSGLPDWKSPSDAKHQPHLLQIAAILANDEGEEIDCFETIVQPGEGCVIDEEAFKAHGISREKAMAEGLPLKSVMDDFFAMASKSKLIVGHNVPFDIRIARIASTRSHGAKWKPEAPTYCTMRKAAPILDLPPTERMIAAGFTGPKSPRLEECVRFFFGEDLEGAHDALVDVRACKRVYETIIGENWK